MAATTWYPNIDVLDLVRVAFYNLGGRSTLQRAYSEVHRMCRETGRKLISDEHVRITIYCYCPGRKRHLDRGDYFTICGRGEYQLAPSTPLADLV